jgi:hypothetical protein
VATFAAPSVRCEMACPENRTGREISECTSNSTVADAVYVVQSVNGTPSRQQWYVVRGVSGTGTIWYVGVDFHSHVIVLCFNSS